MKRLFVLLMVCVLCASVPMIALAKAPPLSIVGDWAISGNASVSATFTPYFTLTFALLPSTFALADDIFTFSSFEFSDSLLSMTGTYTQTSATAYSLDLSDWVSGIETELLLLLDSYGIDPTLGTPKASFTVKLSSAKKFTGTFSLVIPVTYFFISGKVTISGTLTGTYVGPPSQSAAGVPPTPQSLANALLEKVFLPLFGPPAK
ncbi:MAG: hypothetical protein ABSF52_10795 [Syntrophobacteraceae bacterium]